ncbi:hypothetical protein FS764_19320 [Agrobacterium vitis]|uniref:hypothetical protein n=1 Tax=Agrobacterium vitis TaxID=373 RepID=UPI001F2355E3|nr:hypothetical protein [Agrobacterium vitis]MCF1469056.1 hypothetical protein [Agrobacterium vitis]
MTSKVRRIAGISPYNPHLSALPRSIYRNVADKRDRFHNDENAPDVGSAVEFLDRIEPLYDAGRYSAAMSKSGRTTLPGIGQKMSRNYLFWFQLLRSDFDSTSGPRSAAQIAEHIEGVMRDGMLPNERRIVDKLERHLGEPIPKPIEEETFQFNRTLQKTERYRLADQYFSANRALPAAKRRASIPFIKRQIAWRGSQSLNACQALHFLELDLHDKSLVDLRKLEIRYHAGCLPHYDTLPLIASRTARLAICMASVEPVAKRSWLYRLDLVQAALVARKYNAFLSAQKTAIALKGKNPPKKLILKDYLQRI